jgi:DNA-directed RNA polymerase subunit RPC12/RpoP
MELPKKRFRCGNCGETIEVPQGVPKPAECPKCGAQGFMIHRLEPGPPGGRRGRGGPRWQHTS